MTGSPTRGARIGSSCSSNERGGGWTSTLFRAPVPRAKADATGVNGRSPSTIAFPATLVAARATKPSSAVLTRFSILHPKCLSGTSVLRGEAIHSSRNPPPSAGSHSGGGDILYNKGRCAGQGKQCGSFFHSVNLCAMGKRRPMPNAFVVTFRPGAACWRLYSFRSTLTQCRAPAPADTHFLGDSSGLTAPRCTARMRSSTSYSGAVAVFLVGTQFADGGFAKRSPGWRCDGGGLRCGK